MAMRNVERTGQTAPPFATPMVFRRFSPTLAMVIALTLAVGALLDRTWRFGEVFSPADAIFQFYPWAYDAPHTTPSNLSRTDEAFFHQPLVLAFWPRLKAGDWPDLDPSILSGVPTFLQGLAVGQAFSPLSLPFYVTSPPVAVTVYAALRLFAAGLFMFAFMRSRRCLAPAAAAGGLAFALSAPMVVWLSAPMPTVALWLPLAWLFTDRVYDRRRAADAAMLALVIAALWLGAYPPTSLACAVAIVAYGGARAAETRSRRATVLFLVALAASLAIASADLIPTAANLLNSPVAGRSMASAHPPLDGLVTFVLPDFFGNPASHTWWRNGVSYPELVSYLGVGTLLLAACGLAAGRDESGWRRWFFGGLAVATLGIMYGWPPFDWVALLPGFRQVNPMRWNVVLSASVAVLAAYGVDWLARQTRSVRRPLAALVMAVAALGALATIVVAGYRPTIRALSLQPLAWAQLGRSLAIGVAALALVGVGVSVRRVAWLPVRAIVAWTAAALIGVDLVSFGHGFNPTLPADRLYPTTPALRFLSREIGDGRLAPAGIDTGLLAGHVFGVYGLSMVTGFDFRGDTEYQRFLARADGDRPFAGPQWDHVLLSSPDRLDQRLLGLLGASLIVTTPLDAPPPVGRFVPLPELVDGRVVRQTFIARQDNLRRVDVLMATHGRANRGTLTIRVTDAQRRPLAQRLVVSRDVRDNDWLTLEFAPVTRSKGQRFGIELLGRGGAAAGASVAAWAVETALAPESTLAVDGQSRPEVLLFRAFSADDRLGDARLVYARDLNVHRNPHARPRAWFVSSVDAAPFDQQLDRLAAKNFDTRSRAVMSEPLHASPTATATVRAVDLSHPDSRSILVDAPDGGVLVIGERFAPGWTATVDDRPAPLVRANHVLMALAVPPAATHVVLAFQQPTVRPAALVSVLALVAALVTVARRR